MNERIKELIEQATGTGGYFNTEVFDKEKFAELIVKECLKEIWYDMTPKQISDSIKHKFGVE